MTQHSEFKGISLQHLCHAHNVLDNIQPEPGASASCTSMASALSVPASMLDQEPTLFSKKGVNSWVHTHFSETESGQRRKIIYKVNLARGLSLSFGCLHNGESLCQSAIVLCAYSVRKRDNLVFICVKVTGDNGAGCNKFLSLINASESQKGEICFIIRYVLSFTPHQSSSLWQSSISHSSLGKNRVPFVQIHLHLMNIIYYQAWDAGPNILPNT